MTKEIDKLRAETDRSLLETYIFVRAALRALVAEARACHAELLAELRATRGETEPNVFDRAWADAVLQCAGKAIVAWQGQELPIGADEPPAEPGPERVEKDKCWYCERPFGEVALMGAGDGTGHKFLCPDHHPLRLGDRIESLTSELDDARAKLAEKEDQRAVCTKDAVRERDMRRRAESERDAWKECSEQLAHMYNQLAAKQDAYGAKLRRRAEPLTPIPSAVQAGADPIEADVEAAREWWSRIRPIAVSLYGADVLPLLADYAAHVTAELRKQMENLESSHSAVYNVLNAVREHLVHRMIKT